MKILGIKQSNVHTATEKTESTDFIHGSHLEIFQYNVRKRSQAKEKADKRNGSIKNNNNKKKPHQETPQCHSRRAKFKIKKENKYKHNSSEKVCHTLRPVLI